MPQILKALKSIVKNTGIFIISESVWGTLFSTANSTKACCATQGVWTQFCLFSFGKTYHCTGWKIGYCVAPAPMMAEFRKIHQFNCFSTNSTVQFALAEYLKQKTNYLQLGAFIQQKRDYFAGLMQQTKFRLPSYGSYFQLYSYAGFSGENEKTSPSGTKEYGVTAIPVSVFYKTIPANKVLTSALQKKATLEEAVNRLIKL